MHGCDGTCPRVGDEQRDAIGSAHHERYIGRVRDNRVGRRTLVVHFLERLERDAPLDADDISTVHLIQ
jgi:hypothetical protein